MEVKGYEIDNAFARDPQPLTFPHLNRRAEILLDHSSFQNRHPNLLQESPSRHSSATE
jgi:hypothetical protein